MAKGREMDGMIQEGKRDDGSESDRRKWRG
jgi:hypothetical protein